MSKTLLNSINNLRQDLSNSSSMIKDNIDNIRDNKQINIIAEQEFNSSQ